MIVPWHEICMLGHFCIYVFGGKEIAKYNKYAKPKERMNFLSIIDDCKSCRKEVNHEAGHARSAFGNGFG